MQREREIEREREVALARERTQLYERGGFGFPSGAGAGSFSFNSIVIVWDLLFVQPRAKSADESSQLVRAIWRLSVICPLRH